MSLGRSSGSDGFAASRRQGLPCVNGEALPEHLGVLIRQRQLPGPMVSLIPGAETAAQLAARQPFEAWLTMRNEAGVYEERERIDPRAVVTGWDEQGRAFTFDQGKLTIREITEEQT